IISKKFNLPTLENFHRQLTTDDFESAKISPLIPPIDGVAKIDAQLANTSFQGEGEFMQHNVSESVALLPNKLVFLESELEDEVVKMPKVPVKKGLFGKWKKGKSEFRICTYGAFEILDEAPFIQIISPNGVVFIEEYIGGLFKGKINQLTILKAPRSSIGASYNEQEIFENTDLLIPREEQFFFWSNNKTFLFFSKDKRKWLMEHLDEVEYQIKKGNVSKVTERNDEWRRQIEACTTMVDFLHDNGKKTDSLTTKRQEIQSINTVPFKQLEKPKNLSAPFTLGRKVSMGGAISGSAGTNLNGHRYVTLVKGKTIPTVLNHFNFHVTNDFNNLTLDLYLYQVKDGKITHALTEKPITIAVSKTKGWVAKDLQDVGIVSKGDILVVLKNPKYTGSKRKKRLYFSLPTADYKYQPFFDLDYRNSKSWKRSFWEQPFMMYFDAQEELPKGYSMNHSSSSKERILHGSWEIGKSTYKIWATDDVKTYKNMPYVETTASDGMIVIEEHQQKLFGGTKVHQIAITKAPYDGMMVQSFLNGQPNSWSHGTEKDDPLYFYRVDEDWVFLGKGVEKWMIGNMPKLTWRLDNLRSGHQTSNSSSMQERAAIIQEFQRLKAQRFLPAPSETRDALGALKPKPTESKVPLKDIPTKRIMVEKTGSRSIKIGRTKGTKTTAGFSGYEVNDRRFGTLLKGGQNQKILQDLNFKLERNTFQTLTFDVYFFHVEDQEIQYALTEKPIRMEVGGQAGWIKKDLIEHQIGTKGDVLVVIEIVDSKAEKPSLFFSLSPQHVFYKPTDKFYKGEKLPFWDSAFAMYVTAK
ncbi:MAG: hypothetical protein AAGJ18_03505, partial [Bacteroidota bacterium]